MPLLVSPRTQFLDRFSTLSIQQIGALLSSHGLLHQLYADDVQVGIMVETPAAAVMTPVLAKYVDFFSIGTNDLVQYTLAVDRVNHNVSYLYNHFNPAVLQLVQRTIQSGRMRGNPRLK